MNERLFDILCVLAVLTGITFWIVVIWAILTLVPHIAGG